MDNSDKYTNDFSPLMHLVTKLFFCVDNFLNKVSQKYQFIFGKLMCDALKHNKNNHELKMFLHIFFRMIGINLILFLFTVASELVQTFVLFDFVTFNQVQQHFTCTETIKSKSTKYFSSTLYMLVQSNKYTLF